MSAKTANQPRSKRKGQSSDNVVKQFFSLIKDERTPKIAGLFFLLLSLYFLVAFTSYLSTWKSDQDKIFQLTLWQLLDADIQVDNKLGRLGAYTAHQFFYNWFGLTSYIIIWLLFVSGANMVLKKKLFALRKHFKYALLLLVWLSTSLAFLFNFSGFPWGGAFGKAINLWLTGFIGKWGTGFLLLFSMLIFAVWLFNIDFGWKPGFGRKKESESEGEEESEEESVSEGESEGEEEGTVEFNLPEEDITEPEEKPGLDLEIGNAESPEEQGEDPEIPVIAEASDDPDSDLRLDIEDTAEEVAVNKNLQTNYDPTLDLPNYKYPPLDLLEQYSTEKVKIDTEELEKNKDQIIETLNNYNIEISKIKATVGPTVTLYEIIPAAGIRISKIKNLEDDIALSLAALGIRIIAPIPGKGTIGIEVPNVKKEIVAMRAVLGSEKFQNAQMDLPVALGKNISNEIYTTDLAKMPHLLMAGATGQGKSVGVNAILASLLYKKHPSQLKFVLIDPKKVELSLFNHIEKHFLAKLPDEEEPIITDTKKVVKTLNSLCIEMDERYDLLKAAHCKNIKEYNQKFIKRGLNPEKGHRFLPYIVLVVDEFADLMMTAGKEVETPIARLAQLARAIGIHLVIATQRPSVNIITGTIKANFPARIAFKVTSKVDSRTILDTGGAEQLIGRGDMLLSIGSEIIRLQCAFIDTPEVEEIAHFIGQQKGYSDAFLLPEYIDESEAGAGEFNMNEKDEMFEEAARIVVQHQQGSTSLLQRRLKLGYNRAGRLIDQLEAAGIVGQHEGSKAREVLIRDEFELEQFLQELQ